MQTDAVIYPPIATGLNIALSALPFHQSSVPRSEWINWGLLSPNPVTWECRDKTLDLRVSPWHGRTYNVVVGAFNWY